MRSFNKNETQNILAKAAELEMSRSLDGGNDGLTEPEIIELAKESGISISSIKVALLSFNTPQFKHSFNWLKGTSKTEHVEYFDTELRSEQMTKVLQLLQSTENELGETELHSKKLSWSTKREVESLKVTLKEENNRTSFTYSKRWTELRILMSIFLFILAFIITLVTMKGMGFNKFTTLFFAPFGGFIGLAVGWTYLKSKFESHKKKLHTLLDQLRALFLHNDSVNTHIEVDELKIDTIELSSQKIKV